MIKYIVEKERFVKLSIQEYTNMHMTQCLTRYTKINQTNNDDDFYFKKYIISHDFNLIINYNSMFKDINIFYS